MPCFIARSTMFTIAFLSIGARAIASTRLLIMASTICNWPLKSDSDTGPFHSMSMPFSRPALFAPA
jgi:hypothetical protein